MNQLNELVKEIEILKNKISVLESKKEINENSRDIWSTSEIAEYFGFTEEHTRRNIITDPHFPAPLDLKSRTGNLRKKLFISGEVVRYAMRRKQKKAKVYFN